MNIGQLDQLLAAIVDLAKITKKYYETLIGQGFSKQEALYLTAEFQSSILKGGDKK